MSDASSEKLLGFIPKDKYMHFAYMFLLIMGAGNALYSLLAMIGLSLASATPAVITLGVLAAILAGIGLTKLKADFSEMEHAHFKYIIAIFVAFMVLNVVCGAFYMIAYFIGYLVTAALGAAQAVLAWTGYNSWQGGRVITKDNIKAEIQTAIKNR